MRPEYEEQFRRWTPHMQPEDWRGVSFVDCGCGMGRNSYWPMRYGAARGLAIDVDEPLARRGAQNAGTLCRRQVRELSVYELEPTSDFDVAFSIGVIHHLKEPVTALRAMAGPLSRAERFSSGSMDARTMAGSCILCSLRCENCCSAGCRSLSSIICRFTRRRAVVFLRVSSGGIAYFRLLRQFTFRHLRSIVFDQMLPKIAHYWRRSEVDS